jgi:hypothetical protein
MNLTISQLEGTTKENLENIEFYQYLTSLVKGGRDVDKYKKQLVPRRFKEELTPYKLRLDQFIYTNVISSAIDEIVNKFSQATLVVDEATPILETVRQHIYEEQDEIGLLCQILRNLLVWPKLFILVDIKGQLDSDSLEDQLENGYVPVLDIICPTSVLVYQEGKYCKIREMEEVVGIDGEVTTNFVWTIYTPNEAYRYEYTGDFDTLPTELVLVPKVIYHNQGRLPVFEFCLEKSSLVENLYKMQEKYTLIENGLFAAAYASNTIQKVYTPVKTDASTIESDDDIRAGNEYILKAEKFEFVEIKGDSLKVQAEILDNLKQNIKHIACLSGLSFTNKPASNASGYSKEMEFEHQESSLAAYGKVICGIYQTLLNHIQGLYGEPQVVNISGLDNFSLATTTSILADLKEAVALKDELSPTALAALRTKASLSLAEGSSNEIIAKITSEIQ